MIHFDWSISLGQIITAVAVLGLLFKIQQFHNTLLIEHEILVTDYCERKGIKKHELPTRVGGLSIFGGK